MQRRRSSGSGRNTTEPGATSRPCACTIFSPNTRVVFACASARFRWRRWAARLHRGRSWSRNGGSRQSRSRWPNSHPSWVTIGRLQRCQHLRWPGVHFNRARLHFSSSICAYVARSLPRGRNIGRRDVLLELAQAVGLDVQRVTGELDSGRPRQAVLDEARLGQERYRVRGTPTLMLADGTKLRHPIAFARMREERVIGVTPLPCHGQECLQATRDLFERSLEQGAPVVPDD